MPKRLLISLAVAALAIAACHSNSSVTPTPSSSPGSPKPNPSITSATILVTILGTPVAHIPVEESTPKNKVSPRPGKPFETKHTGKHGHVQFTHLKPSRIYCWVAVLGSRHTSSECASFDIWQNETINLGT
ncbi:MAG TPA: hypothetical protein VGZ06_06675 [Candidatus Cybelea sp.]|jgi:hypothetical protein|nr:hypothetical protein [Candidatus Cybelea sp.]